MFLKRHFNTGFWLKSRAGLNLSYSSPFFLKTYMIQNYSPLFTKHIFHHYPQFPRSTSLFLSTTKRITNPIHPKGAGKQLKGTNRSEILLIVVTGDGVYKLLSCLLWSLFAVCSRAVKLCLFCDLKG